MTFTSETLPADHKAAIRQLKRELRAQIGDVQAVFNKLSDSIATRVAEINALKNKGESVWPVIPFNDVKNGTITDAQREAVKRRGCAVIKGHFPREQALAWDQSMLDYLDLNKAVVRPGRERDLPGSYPPPSAGNHLERTRRAYRLRRPGALAAAGIPAGLCPRV